MIFKASRTHFVSVHGALPLPHFVVFRKSPNESSRDDAIPNGTFQGSNNKDLSSHIPSPPSPRLLIVDDNLLVSCNGIGVLLKQGSVHCTRLGVGAKRPPEKQDVGLGPAAAKGG